MQYKRIRKNFFIRIRKGLPFAAKIFGYSFFVVVVGMATLINSTGNNLKISQILYGASICTGVSLIALVIKGSLSHLPDDILFNTLSNESYVSDYCTKTTLELANGLTQPYYHHEYVEDRIAEMWRIKNSKGFVHILNQAGDVCASFGILAIKASFMEYFVKGDLQDNNLGSDEVLTFEQSKKSKELYISGVVVSEPDNIIGRRRALVMIWCMINYIKNIYGIKKERKIYALAVSKQSENLLKRSGFQIECSKKNRIDKLNLYSLIINKDSINDILLRVGDYSTCCKCMFSSK